MVSGGSAPAVYNAANEVAVAAFLEHRIPYLAIPEVVTQTLANYAPPEAADLVAVREIDREARRVASAALVGR